MQSHQERLCLAALVMTAWVFAAAPGCAARVAFSTTAGSVSIEVERAAVLSDVAVASLLRANLTPHSARPQDVMETLLSTGMVAAYKEQGPPATTVVSIDEDPSLHVIRAWLVLPPRAPADLVKIHALFGSRATDLWAKTMPPAATTGPSWQAYRALSTLAWPLDETTFWMGNNEAKTWVRLVVWNDLLGQTRYSLRHSAGKTVAEIMAEESKIAPTARPDLFRAPFTRAAKAAAMSPRDGAQFLWREYGGDGARTYLGGLTKALALQAGDDRLWLKAQLAGEFVGWESLAEQLADKAKRTKTLARGSALVDRSLKESPDDAVLWFAKGNIGLTAWALHQGELGPVKAAYEKACQLAAEWYVPYARLAEINGYEGDWQACRAAFEKALGPPCDESARRLIGERFIFAAVSVGPTGAAKEIADSLVASALLDRAAAEDALALGYEARGDFAQADPHWKAAHAALLGKSIPLATPR